MEGRAKSVWAPTELQVERVEQLRPDDKKSALIFARLGYSVPEAIADLVDNSIDAKARRVLVRIVRTDEKIHRVLIADNGEGMNDGTLLEAMRFGSRTEKGPSALGKYGIGLKAASLSQAKIVTVLSKHRGRYVGRRWTYENIGKGWVCEVIKTSDVARALSDGMPPVGLRRSGTVVVWEDLEHLAATKAGIETTIQETLRELSNDIGLRFHRFIDAKRLKVYLDVQTVGAPPSTIRQEVLALDPFDYPSSGRDGYPKSFQVPLGPAGRLKIECHIWPAKSEEPGYKLGGGKVSARQGFYFYRNDRLIQAGGWNGSREDDNEPHLSLARVKVNLPPAFDGLFKLDVRKSKVEPPPTFAPNVNAVEERSGSFRQYVRDAQLAYRRQKKKDGALFSFLPGRGFPATTRGSVRRILWEKGTGRPQLVHFAWEELDPDVFVELDRERSRIVLNALYRSRVLASKRASGADAPVVKLLFLLLLQEEFPRRASSERYREWMEKINHAMVAVLKKGA
jgi:hypothetical protein